MVAARLRAVFFDAGGTLFHVRGSVGSIYAAEARRFGVHVDPEELQIAFLAAFHAAPPLAFPGVPATEIERHERVWWKRIVRRAFEGHTFSDFDAFFDDLFAGFASPAWWVVFPDVEPTLARLRAAGLILGIISNFDGRAESILQGLGLESFFDSLTLSGRVGFAKPDRRIFEHALRRHGLEPEEALHAGDSSEEDVEGAQRAGMRGVLVQRAGGRGLGAVADLAGC
jgi:putative hydrolase of the HAD superfamily